MQPLPEVGREIHPRHLLGHLLERRLAHMLELPAVVVGPHDLAQSLVAHDVAELMEEDFAPGVNRGVVGVEVAVILAHQAGRLGAAVQIESGNEPLGPGKGIGAGLQRFEEE